MCSINDKPCDIEKIKRRLLVKYPFFGSLAAKLEFAESRDIKKTETDGEKLYYNPDYLEGLTDDEQVFCLAHEICHVAFNHILRSEGKNQVIWQLATDAVINQLLKKDGLEIIKGGADYPDAIDYDADEFYDILMAEKMEIDLIGGSYDSNMWEDAVDRHNEKEKKREEELLQELQDIQDLIDGLEGKDDPEEDLDIDLDDEDLALFAKEVSDAGNSEDRDAREVSTIGVSAPIIDWRLILRDTVNYGVDWSFTNAVIEDGIVRPALEERPMPETEIVLDTSWSVEEDLLRNFLRECKNILQHSKLKAGCFDTKFYGFQEIKTEKDIDEMTFDGGGGTDFNVAVDAFSMRVDNRIIFTDGEAPMPDKTMNAVWLVYGEETIEPKGGTVIHITPEQLNKLMGRADGDSGSEEEPAI